MSRDAFTLWQDTGLLAPKLWLSTAGGGPLPSHAHLAANRGSLCSWNSRFPDRHLFVFVCAKNGTTGKVVLSFATAKKMTVWKPNEYSRVPLNCPAYGRVHNFLPVSSSNSVQVSVRIISCWEVVQGSCEISVAPCAASKRTWPRQRRPAAGSLPPPRTSWSQQYRHSSAARPLVPLSC